MSDKVKGFSMVKNDPNNIELDNSHTKILLFTEVDIWQSKICTNVNSVNTLHLIFSKVNGYFEEINKCKYLTLLPTNESKANIKKYQELWSKIRDSVKSRTKNSGDYLEKYGKTKFNSDKE